MKKVSYILTAIATIFPLTGTAKADITRTLAVSNRVYSTFEMLSSERHQFNRVYIDSDDNPSTGFRQNGIGAEYLIENSLLYRYRGTGTNWDWNFIKSVTYSATATRSFWQINRSDIDWLGSPKSAGVVFQQETLQQPILTSAPSRHISHAADQASIFPNPERGFFKFNLGGCTSTSFQLQRLQRIRREGITLIYCPIELNSFINSRISSAFLTTLSNNLSVVRQSGMKVIMRAQYANDASVPESARNASLANILMHIQQLGPVLSANADVIAGMHAGFIGVWGEWWTTTREFGNNGVVSAAQWIKRKAVVDALLAVLPTALTVSVRTPRYKQAMYGASPLTSSEAYSGTPRARIGFHNDCFLANATDGGTFLTSAERQYAMLDLRYVPMGGETCAPSAYSLWPSASVNLSQLRFSNLNRDYNLAVLNSWGANLNEVKRRLGYRLFVSHTYFPKTAPLAGEIRISVGFGNMGYAAPINPRPIELVFRNRTTGAITRKPLRGEVRSWFPGKSQMRADQDVSLSGLPSGTYDLGLAFPDRAFALRARAAYAIRLANTVGWDATTGVNYLGHVLQIR